jgi:hypothetical protein
MLASADELPPKLSAGVPVGRDSSVARTDNQPARPTADDAVRPHQPTHTVHKRGDKFSLAARGIPKVANDACECGQVAIGEAAHSRKIRRPAYSLHPGAPIPIRP